MFQFQPQHLQEINFNYLAKIILFIYINMGYDITVGTRAQVWHGTAKHTSGNLYKKHLMKNKHGRIVSKKLHHTAKKQKRLVKAGYIPKKGQFVVMRKSMKKLTKHHKKKNKKHTKKHGKGKKKTRKSKK